MKGFELVIALLIGLAVGCGLTAYFALKWADSYMTDASFVGVSDRYQVLQALRTGDTNSAINSLELQMNGQILAFAGMKQGIPIAKLKPSDIKLISRVRDYRAMYPYKESTEIDPTVASILSLTNTTLLP
jgi:hypothetical protein